MPVNCEGTEDMEYLCLTDEFGGSASCTLNYMSVCRDDITGDEESAAEA